MWDTAVITKSGAALLEQWASGGTLTIDEVKTGAGKVDAAQAGEATSVTDEKQTPSITRWTKLESGIRCEIVLNAPEQSYVCHQIGIYAHLNSEAKTLMALYQDEVGIDIPASADMPEFQYTFFAALALDNTGELTVNVNPALYVTPEEMQRAIDEKIGEALPGGIATKAKTLETPRALTVDLASTAEKTFDGSANVDVPVKGVLGVANGGTGNADGNAETAEKWKTPRKIAVDLAATADVTVDGSKDADVPIKGILAAAHGGTGNANGIAMKAKTLETPRKINGVAFDGGSDISTVTVSTADLEDGVSPLETGKIYLVYSEGE